jgi:hypothetical protein
MMASRSQTEIAPNSCRSQKGNRRYEQQERGIMTAGFSVKKLNGLVGDRIERLVIFNRSPKADPDSATRNSVEKNFRLLQ